MTEDSPPTETEKTTAEREAEIRARVREELSRHAATSHHHPGQPEVTRFRKKTGHRTLLVMLLSLALLVALALGGDRLLERLKHKKQQDTETTASTTSHSVEHERRDLGMDSNPFGLFGQPQQQTTPAQASPPVTTLPSESATLNKAAALTDRLSNTADTQQDGAMSTANSPPQSALAKGQENRLRSPDDNTALAKVTGVRRLSLDPDLYLPVDRYIPCAMMQRFVSDVGGHISCLISEDVYSASNHVKLLPAGTLARGIYQTGALQHGRSRMFVIWTELRTPEPGSLQIPLLDTAVTGQLGEMGIAGRIDNHFWQRFGNALMLSTVQDVAAAAAKSAPSKDRNTDYTENSRAAAAEMARITLENSINIPPTLYLNQGDVIGIMTGTDIDFSSLYQLRLKKRWYER